MFIFLAATDFKFDEMNVTFQVPDREKLVTVFILNDDIVERDESFSIMITPVPGVYPLQVLDPLVMVDIIDDDGKLSLLSSLSLSHFYP